MVATKSSLFVNTKEERGIVVVAMIDIFVQFHKGSQ